MITQALSGEKFLAEKQTGKLTGKLSSLAGHHYEHYVGYVGTSSWSLELRITGTLSGLDTCHQKGVTVSQPTMADKRSSQCHSPHQPVPSGSPLTAR